ncbi:hypothetical protein U1Q18_025770 [Sarracenia purpurea var. burkii]
MALKIAGDRSFQEHGSETKSKSATLTTSFNVVSLQLAGEGGLHPSLDDAPDVSVPRARADSTSSGSRTFLGNSISSWGIRVQPEASSAMPL